MIGRPITDDICVHNETAISGKLAPTYDVVITKSNSGQYLFIEINGLATNEGIFSIYQSEDTPLYIQSQIEPTPPFSFFVSPRFLYCTVRYLFANDSTGNFTTLFPRREGIKYHVEHRQVLTHSDTLSVIDDHCFFQLIHPFIYLTKYSPLNIYILD